MGRLDARVVGITGTDGLGIGRALALVCAEEGALIAHCGVNDVAGAQLDLELRRAGCQSFFMPADLRETESVKRFIGTAISEFGRIDCLVNNAGRALPEDRDIHETPKSVVLQAIVDNLLPAYECMQGVLGDMCERRSGAILNISSINAIAGGLGQVGYSMAKAALGVLARHATAAYAHRGVRCNVAMLGTTPNANSPRWEEDPDLAEAIAHGYPTGCLPTPEDVARSLIWFLSDESKFLTGAVVPIDCGLTAVKTLTHGSGWREELRRMAHLGVFEGDCLGEIPNTS